MISLLPRCSRIHGVSNFACHLSEIYPRCRQSRRFSKKTATHTVPVKLAYISFESLKGTGSPKPDADLPAEIPIMIMHGLFGSKNNWNSLAKAIHQKTNRKVIAVDARNHGDSPHSSEMSYRHMAQDVVELLKDLKFRRAILIGHSMGGSAMMYAALTHPELVEKLIVVDMSPIRTSPSLAEMAKIFQAMRSVTFEGNPSLTKARRMAEEQMATTITSAPIRQFLLMNLVESPDSGKFKWRVNLPVLQENFKSNIATFPDVDENSVYNGPTLFIGGSNSDYIKVEDHPAIKRLFPKAEFHYVAGANHWVHADKPQEFLSLVTNFVNR